MAYIKAKNFASAEEDCSSALRLNPNMLNHGIDVVRRVIN